MKWKLRTGATSIRKSGQAGSTFDLCAEAVRVSHLRKDDEKMRLVNPRKSLRSRFGGFGIHREPRPAAHVWNRRSQAVREANVAGIEMFLRAACGVYVVRGSVRDL